MSNEIQKLVKPGNRVELQQVKRLASDDEDNPVYVTKVYDISEDEDKIETFMPMDKTKLILLPVGAIYEASFYCDKGIYGCRLQVEKRYKDNTLFVVGFDQITELEKQQRREFYRFDCVIGMNTRVLSDDESKDYLESADLSLFETPQDKSVIVDLSGGGLRFVSAEKYEKGNLVYCRFMISNNGKASAFPCVMKVLGTKPVANNPKNTEYRGCFVELGKNDRDKLIKFIFEEERKSRQRQ